ncbi:monosaccharide ABC transporter ATP-binding protein (CUT2 family) [Microcella alkaliphila]|uniref:Monosaccharide ABC transporter ATP-binding protein (CUT2 family) n=1 Tax=Microcella alkaliphila TaxID=279828 RepID=A0A4Q7TJV8_9MICO|nr:sugar ABC transporter ATP-binding protein [Microcella alkaliphila]RZT60905.1 monosaccharide ABC transporter ATP-binding protein (CUT2 family) [Microcella alkaliphila]
MSHTELIAQHGSPSAPQIEVRGVSKVYGPTTVLDDVNLTISPGEIHAILGENGAGKSTLLKVIGGAITATSGSLLLDGEPVTLGSPRDAIRHGITLISQELAVIPQRSVMENVMLGRWSHRAGFAHLAADRVRFDDLLDRTGFTLDPDATVGELPLGIQQQVEILKALARGARVLCMDEPTAALNDVEKELLLRVVREIADRGTTIIIVSHFLEEVLGLADRVTVLRDGKLIETNEASAYTPASIVSLMVGREVDPIDQPPAEVSPLAQTVVDVERLETRHVHDISFALREGEIVGLAGLVGSGRSDVLLGLLGAEPRRAGTIRIRGAEVKENSVSSAIASGMALVPESRKDQALLLGRSVTENVALGTLAQRSFGGWVRRRVERAEVSRVSADVDLRGVGPDTLTVDLSGGNQQKALFARWLLHPPALLMVDEPTRGVDVAAKARIHSLIRDLAARGTAVLVVSSELDEVIRLSHRVLVMRHGRIVDEFDRSARPSDILTSAFTK